MSKKQRLIKNVAIIFAYMLGLGVITYFLELNFWTAFIITFLPIFIVLSFVFLGIKQGLSCINKQEKRD